MANISSSIRIALPYAEALFELSQYIQLVEKTRQDLNTVLTIIDKSKSLETFLINPLVSMNTKKTVLSNLLMNQVSDHVLNFLFVLIERRRINLFSLIVNCYGNLVNKLALVTLAVVYTAIPLNDLQKKTLQNKLQVLTDSKLVQLTIHIKPDLIAGFVIKIGSKVIDMSIYGQLNKISSYLNTSSL